MRKHTLTIVVVLLAVLASSFAGAIAGRLVPGAGQWTGVTAASAASLNVEAAAPLTSSGSGFTYQGRLKDGSNPASGQYDFQFTLYDALAGGALVAGPVTQANQTVSEGLFSVVLDFGSTAFNGDARYLEIAVRPTGGGGYTTLTPLQPITPAPYALFALKTKGYKNVVTVSPEGGDFTSVQAALNSITTNSSTNKFLVWVGPGTYTERVTMKPWVDIEGAGEKVTRITFTGSAGLSGGTVVGASNAELRSLSVENTGGNTYATAIYNNAASPSLLHVIATASGGTNNYGVLNDIYSSTSMNNVTATASGEGTINIGVYNFTSSPIMNDVTATASGGVTSVGVENSTSSTSMNNVVATASGEGTIHMGVYNFISSPIMNDITIEASGGSYQNVGVQNSSSSPSITNVTITASGGFRTYGISSSAGTLIINYATITASGASDANYGVYSEQVSPIINYATVTATGTAPSDNGVFTVDGSLTMNFVTVTANSGLNSNGVYTNSGNSTINNSIVTSSRTTVGGILGNAFIGASKLKGGQVLGPATCAGVYDENFAFFANTCP